MAKSKSEDKKFTTDEEVSALLKIKEYKDICEENIVGILWKNTELYYYHDSLTLDSFTNNKWRVYWQIGYDIVIKEKKTLDENTIDVYLKKHSKLKAKYDDYGGYKTVLNIFDNVLEADIEGYINELEKWGIVTKMVKSKFPVAHRLKDFVDMSIDEIYDENEALLNHIFLNTNSLGSVRTSDIAEGLDDLLKEIDKGKQVGLPYYNLNLLTSETNGIALGNMYLFLATSGAGKSSFIRSTILPSILEKDEKILFIINEEDISRQKTELLIWVANNILGKSIQKYVMNNGNFDSDTWKILLEAKDWVEQHKGQVMIAALDSYTTDKAIKVIKKYVSMGVNYVILDTFKHDSSSKSEAAWLEMQMNSVKLFDLIKPVNKNVALICTMQLTKQSTKQRYLTLESVASAKNVVDVCSGVTLMRWLLPDEYPGERNEVKVYKMVGKGTKVPVKIQKDKRYQVLFLAKNRFGTSGDYQVVIEVDLSRNKFVEKGICFITPDF